MKLTWTTFKSWLVSTRQYAMDKHLSMRLFHLSKLTFRLMNKHRQLLTEMKRGFFQRQVQEARRMMPEMFNKGKEAARARKSSNPSLSSSPVWQEPPKPIDPVSKSVRRHQRR